jgi:hypothetical protein
VHLGVEVVLRFFVTARGVLAGISDEQTIAAGVQIAELAYVINIALHDHPITSRLVVMEHDLEVS